MFPAPIRVFHIYQLADLYDPNAGNMLGELKQKKTSFRYHFYISKTSKSIQLTLCRRLAQKTLESTACVNELHMWTHVGLASNTPDRSKLTKVDNWWLHFFLDCASHWRHDKRKWNCTLFHHLSGRWNIVHCRANITWSRIALILRQELGRNERWNLTDCRRREDAARCLLIFGHHLNGIGHLIGIETT